MEGKFDPVEIVNLRIAQGEISRESVDIALTLWRRQLQEVRLPNGERMKISERDIHHVLSDNRILRKPNRISDLIDGIFEIRTAKFGRREALSTWDEDGEALFGYAILDTNGSIRTLHVIDERKLRKKQRKGTLLWTR